MFFNTIILIYGGLFNMRDLSEIFGDLESICIVSSRFGSKDINLSHRGHIDMSSILVVNDEDTINQGCFLMPSDKMFDVIGLLTGESGLDVKSLGVDRYVTRVLIDFKYVVVYVLSQRTFDGVDILVRLSDDFNIEGESSSFFDSVFEEMLSIDYTR